MRRCSSTTTLSLSARPISTTSRSASARLNVTSTRASSTLTSSALASRRAVPTCWYSLATSTTTKSFSTVEPDAALRGSRRCYSSVPPPEPSPVLLEIDQALATITLNNPRERNALSASMMESLLAHLKNLSTNTSVRVVVLRAAGPVFSSGHNIKEMKAAKDDSSYYEYHFRLSSSVCEAIRALHAPVIAMVDGLATAAGAQLVATCDLVIATEDSQFATPGVKIGLFCTTPAVAVGRAINSRKKMMEMLLTGEPITAQEAERYGLVNKVVSKAKLEETTRDIVDKILSYSGPVIALGKKSFYQQIAEPDVSKAYRMAEQVMVKNVNKDDCQEGMAAFIEKRKPRWHNK